MKRNSIFDYVSLVRRRLRSIGKYDTLFEMEEHTMNTVPKRVLGNTGEHVSILCLGGGHIGSGNLSLKESVRIMHRAIDHGLTFFDNAWEYNEGRSESFMGEAIHDRREKVFLMTKVCARDRLGAEQNLEDSLRRFRTDHIDLWQFHEINYANDPDWIFAPGGAAEAARNALESGKVRYVGDTGRDGRFELYKTTQRFDSPVHRAQHQIP